MNAQEAIAAIRSDLHPAEWIAQRRWEAGRVLAEAVERLKAENERLQVVVEKLPKFADGSPVVLGELAYAYDCELNATGYNDFGTEIHEGVVTAIEQVGADCWLLAFGLEAEYWLAHCYSTREAASKARERTI